MRSILPVALAVLCVSAASQVKPTSGLPVARNMTLDGDPFETINGLYFRSYTDFKIADDIPIDFVRTIRNRDPQSHGFGRGGRTSYDIYIAGDALKFSWLGLYFPDGSWATFKRTNPGIHFYDGIFENTEPGEFLHAHITWNGPARNWRVQFKDGREYTILGCGANDKPSACALVEIKNAKGQSLGIQRDVAGNILRITSPHGHYLAMTNDAQGRITRIEDDSHKSTSYSYDDNGCLKEVHTWKDDLQQFRYDAHFNMTWVHEQGPQGSDGKGPYNFVVKTFFDSKNRFSHQVISNGDTYAATYHTDPKGLIMQTDVRDNHTTLKIFFPDLTRMSREELWRANKREWAVQYDRDGSQEITGATLVCGSKTIKLPAQPAEELAEVSNDNRYFISTVCQNLVKGRSTTKKSEPRGISGQNRASE